MDAKARSSCGASVSEGGASTSHTLLLHLPVPYPWGSDNKGTLLIDAETILSGEEYVYKLRHWIKLRKAFFTLLQIFFKIKYFNFCQ